MSQYRVAREAERDLDEIWLYIESDNPAAAEEWLTSVEDRFRLLAENPLAGTERSELSAGLRSLPVGNYIIFYFPISDGVSIARVLHGARDYGPEFF